MKAKEIREMSSEEIQQRVSETANEINNARFQHAVSDLEDPMALRRKRRELARLKTILRERQA